MAVLNSGTANNHSAESRVSLILRNLHVLFSLVRIEMRQKYAGSLLGVFWIVLYPLVFLIIYSGIYLLVFEVRIPELSNWGYILTVFCGLVPYIGFSDSLQQGSQSLAGNINLLKNTVFPPLLIPVKSVWVSQLAHAVSLAILFCMALVSGYLKGAIWLVPFVFVLQILFIQGLVWFVSFLAVVIKDLQYILNLVLFFTLFISPVAFTPAMAPVFVQRMIELNPLYYTIALYRYGFLGGEAFPGREILVMTLFSVIIFALGLTFFKRSHKLLLEYV